MKINSKLPIFFIIITALLGLGYLFRMYQIKIQETPQNIVIESDQFAQQSETLPEKNISSLGKSLGYTSLMEEQEIPSLSVEGSIPSWLCGTLLRNGPAQFELNGTNFTHWFDGFAMIHRFTFNNGIVSYANKFIKSTYRAKAIKKGKLPSGFNEEDKPKSSWFSAVGKLFAKPPVYDNTNVNISIYGKNTVALTETPHAIMFNPKTLDTLGEVTYDDKVDAHIATAHPLIDPETHELFNVQIQYGSTSHYQIYSMQPGSTKRSILASSSTPYPSYIHSFGLTKHYVVLILIPLVVNPMDLLFSNKSFISNFTWKPEMGTQLIVVNRKTGKEVGSYKTDPFFFFHIANSYDENDTITIDLVSYKNHNVIHETQLASLRSNKPSESECQLSRLAIHLKQGKATIKPFSDYCIELPTINDNYSAQPYTFIYGVNRSDKQIFKINTKTLQSLTWQEDGCFAGEALFVPKPNAKSEDEGVILSVILDTKNKNSFLVILDAKSMKELGRANVPHHIPFGFHGKFLEK